MVNRNTGLPFNVKLAKRFVCPLSLWGREREGETGMAVLLSGMAISPCP